MSTVTCRLKMIICFIAQRVQVVSSFQLPTTRETGERVSDVLQPYVEVSVYGVPLDCASHRTRVLRTSGAGFHAVWDEALPAFRVHVPELALVRFAVRHSSSSAVAPGSENVEGKKETEKASTVDNSSSGDTLVAQFVVRFTSLLQGFRSVPLCEPSGAPSRLARLFVETRILQLEKTDSEALPPVIQTKTLDNTLQSQTSAIGTYSRFETLHFN